MGPGFGMTLDAANNVWITSTSSNTISRFDTAGRPLSPPRGCWNFDGQLGEDAGELIATPSGDIWALDATGSKLVFLPQGDPAKGRLFCQNPGGNPLEFPAR